MKKTIHITGMHCAACKALIEDIASDIPGITSCNVNLQKNTADVEYTTEKALQQLKKEVETEGEHKILL